MKNKRVIKSILIILIICVLLILLVFRLNNIRDSKENLKYINSDEMEKGTVSPDMIHVILALYKGNVNPKSITKSTYYFINTVIPNYKRKCKNIDDAKRYFEKNKEDIYLDIGIKEEEKFLDLIEEINKIGNSKIESSRFDKDYIVKNNDSLETILYIKYKNGKENSFKVIISNYGSKEEPPITYSVY